MSNEREVEDDDSNEAKPASRYRDEIAPPSVGPGQPQPAQGIAPSSSKVGEDIEQPQYGNVIRPSLEHDEKEGDHDRLDSDDVLRP